MKYGKYFFIITIICALFINVNKTYAKTVDNSLSISNDNVMKIDRPIINFLDNQVDCDGIFGSKSNPNSIRYLIDEILQYPRIIVPILVICLGMFDFAKAVISSKEDQMKKAQTTFVKRLLIAVCVFLIPTIIDILMYLADIVWSGGYTHCDF